MLPLTTKVVAELDVLYGLYQLAVDLARRIQPDDETLTQRVLEARQKLLERTGAASQEVKKLLKAFAEEKLVPANEKALVEEKRKLILDLGTRIQAADHQVVRAMQAKLGTIRRELAGQTERKNAIQAYLRSPQATVT